jgi:hypothetical protein
LLRHRWDAVQVGFVDDPRRAVVEADALVSSAIDDIVNGFRSQRERLDGVWAEGSNLTTDELREAFQLYRTFFGRLLEV